jgi:hypothetical protein
MEKKKKKKKVLFFKKNILFINLYKHRQTARDTYLIWPSYMWREEQT